VRRRRTSREQDDRAPRCARQIEELVRTVAALDGPRAADLLSGLSGSARPHALQLLGHLERGHRSERHARLATVFARPPPSPAGLEGVPGRLGTLLRARPDGPGTGERTTDAGSLARWARRLLAELDGAVYPR
jgi:hypothetical protein